MQVKELMPPEDGISRETSPIMCFCLGITRVFHPPLYPLVSAIVTWAFENRQGNL